LPLAFGENRIHCQRAFPRSADAGDDDELVAGNIDVDVFEIVNASAADVDELAVIGGRAS